MHRQYDRHRLSPEIPVILNNFKALAWDKYPARSLLGFLVTSCSCGSGKSAALADILLMRESACRGHPMPDLLKFPTHLPGRFRMPDNFCTGAYLLEWEKQHLDLLYPAVLKYLDRDGMYQCA